MTQQSKFLSAEWRYLAMLNYEIDPAVLQPYVPRGVELDSWQGKTFASMVGFLFLNTRVLGLPVPFHTDFEEVNLRFYGRRRGEEGWRRGVVFIKEIVPKRAIATVARMFYNENYVAMPMRHIIEEAATPTGTQLTVGYDWRFGDTWHKLWVKTQGDPQPLVAGSEEEFITEHYWGYAAQKDGGCVEYRVEHPPWRVWSVAECEFTCDVARLYGPSFGEALQARPSSAFLAEGSPVAVRRGVRINE
jgi:uncharacterized protein YqjF (DUF2071 family)